MAYEHLRLEREAPINLRHPRRGGAVLHHQTHVLMARRLAKNSRLQRHVSLT